MSEKEKCDCMQDKCVNYLAPSEPDENNGIWIVMTEGYVGYKILGATRTAERAHQLLKEKTIEFGAKKVAMYWTVLDDG